MPYICETIPDYNNEESDDEIEIRLPAVWVICDYCRGEGHHCRHLGAITSDEFSDWHPDEREDYFAGRYDKTCDVCNGTGKALEVDHAAVDRDPALKRQYEMLRECRRIDREIEAEYEAERRFGC